MTRTVNTDPPKPADPLATSYVRQLATEARARKAPKRVPINIAPEVREKLHLLVIDPELTGVGYSAFVAAAVIAYKTGGVLTPEMLRAQQDLHNEKGI